MTLLKKAPPEAVRSLPELFAIASALEEEAAIRYRELAAKMREHGAPATAAVFEHLADEEQKHWDRVAQWSQRQSGKPPTSAEIRWEIPETFDEEAADIAGSRLATPYRALSMAVRNEERAFSLWSYIAAHAQEAAIRRTAEDMAREELEHVAMLRRERRRAYHAARDAQGRPAPRARSAAEVLVEAADLEKLLADRLERLSQECEADMQQRVRELARESRPMAEEIARAGAPEKPRVPSAEPVDLQQVLATAELLVERYFEAADRAPDEITMTRAQSLAKRAITRLASLRSLEPSAAGAGAQRTPAGA